MRLQPINATHTARFVLLILIALLAALAVRPPAIARSMSRKPLDG